MKRQDQLSEWLRRQRNLAAIHRVARDLDQRLGGRDDLIQARRRTS